jgi:hypothetical protein
MGGMDHCMAAIVPMRLYTLTGLVLRLSQPTLSEAEGVNGDSARISFCHTDCVAAVPPRHACPKRSRRTQANGARKEGTLTALRLLLVVRTLGKPTQDE